MHAHPLLCQRATAICYSMMRWMKYRTGTQCSKATPDPVLPVNCEEICFACHLTTFFYSSVEVLVVPLTRHSRYCHSVELAREHRHQSRAGLHRCGLICGGEAFLLCPVDVLSRTRPRSLSGRRCLPEPTGMQAENILDIKSNKQVERVLPY